MYYYTINSPNHSKETPELHRDHNRKFQKKVYAATQKLPNMGEKRT